MTQSTPPPPGFRMPAEWSRHDGCWMLWPERPDNWRDGAMPGRRAFSAVASAIAQGEPVRVGASANALPGARAMLPPGVEVVELAANDAWMRDVGPTFLRDTAGRLRGIDWQFNAWGGGYGEYALDDRVAAVVLAAEQVPSHRCPMVMEGGAIHTDGERTLLTTRAVLLDPGRNPGLTEAAAETLFREYLGVEKVIWLPEGVPEDETGGHVDNLCCFVAPARVLLTWTDDRDDPLHPICRAAEAILRTTRDALGRRLQVERIPQPGPLYRTDAEAAGLAPPASPGPRPLTRPARSRLAASYVNFYVGNGVLVMPELDPRHDRVAARILQDLFPDRRVIGVPSREILLGGGNIHCITQQVPARGPHPFA